MTEYRSSQCIAHGLCLFFGMLGAHRFYVGKFWSGLLMLLTLGLGGFWQLFDLIWIGRGTFEDADGHLLLVQHNNAFTGQKSQLITYLLCLLGGFLGLHRFYLGRHLSGILMLCTLGGLGAWWLIDILIVGGGLMRDVDHNLTKH